MFAISVALLMAWRAATWVRRRGASSWEPSLGGPPLYRRPRRHIGSVTAAGDETRPRTLALSLRCSPPEGTTRSPHLDVGVVLQPRLGRLRRRAAQTETTPTPEPLALGAGNPMPDLWGNGRLS